MAGMFTVAMMQRNNEHLPMLSAGVPTQRIVAPVLLCACFMLGLSVLNQEMLIPRIGNKLNLDRNDPEGERQVAARSAWDLTGIHLEGERAVRKTLTIEKFGCMIPETINGNLIHISAKEARYHPGKEPQHGTWELIGCPPDKVEPIPDLLEVRDVGRYILHTRSV